MISDLAGLVETCLRGNDLLCAQCGQSYAVHSDSGAHCPDMRSKDAVYLQTRFDEEYAEKQAASAAD